MKKYDRWFKKKKKSKKRTDKRKNVCELGRLALLVFFSSLSLHKHTTICTYKHTHTDRQTNKHSARLLKGKREQLDEKEEEEEEGNSAYYCLMNISRWRKKRRVCLLLLQTKITAEPHYRSVRQCRCCLRWNDSDGGGWRMRFWLLWSLLLCLCELITHQGAGGFSHWSTRWCSHTAQCTTSWVVKKQMSSRKWCVGVCLLSI